ncbi:MULTISPECIES: AAA family ATPase [Spirulina sp. CCY15215]|uniref:AAA family ATPase n=1 Tax=Spirulina sp. CCY15215 TaxID=2767591 RepID=UPI00194DC2E1|nr:AAA family ATPase [Spirulina major]
MLKNIQIRGYKSIKRLDLKLTNFNVLIGANGAGKSNLISFFKLLRWMIQSGTGQLQYFIGQSGGGNPFLFDGLQTTSRFQAELNFETDAGRNDYSIILSHADPDTLIFASERYRFSRFDREGTADWIYLDSGHRESRLINAANNGEDKTAKTIFSLIQRCVYHQFHNTSENSRIRQRWDIDDNRYLKEDAANLAPFLFRLREYEPQCYSRIVETIRQITPFFADFVFEPVGNKLILQWRELESDLLFSSHQASDGTLRSIALIALLLQPRDQLPDILIFDEPELGLHPYAINIIAGLMQSISQQTQIILATQSASLIDYFQPEDIIVVERKGRESIFHRKSYEELQDWLEDYSLSELWDKNVIGGRPSK